MVGQVTQQLIHRFYVYFLLINCSILGPSAEILIDTINAHVISMSIVKEEVVQLNAQVAELTTADAEKSSQIVQLNAQVAELTTADAEKSRHISKLEKQVIALMSQLDDLKSELSNLRKPLESTN